MNLCMNSPYFCWLYDLTFKAVASHLILPQQIILVVLYKNVLKYSLIYKEEEKKYLFKKIRNSANYLKINKILKFFTHKVSALKFIFC